MGKITLKNINSFLEGYSKLALHQINLLPQHIKEQVAYRMLLCGDCLKQGKCNYCGCDVPGKLYVNKSCNNGERFPDLMSGKEWEEFKKTHGI